MATEVTMQTIATTYGIVEVSPITTDTFKRLRQLLPFGVVGMQHRDSQDIEYGIVMQCDDDEVFGVKLQPIDVDRKQADYLLQGNTILIAHALPRYLQHGFSGVMIPLPYLRDKGDRFESGITLFIFPDPAGKEAAVDIPYAGGFDKRFGSGCTAMLTAFITALKQSAAATGISLYTPIGLEPRPRLQLGSLLFGYLALGQTIVALKTTVTEKDITWSILREADITKVQHMPARPVGISKHDLRLAKPGLQV